MNQSQISYKLLRKINPETARTAVLEYLKSNGGNVAETARVFAVQRVTVYNILIKSRQGDLKDGSKVPKRVANKTSHETEKKVLRASLRTGFGAKRLQKYLARRYKIEIAYGTLRGILRRNSKFKMQNSKLRKNFYF